MKAIDQLAVFALPLAGGHCFFDAIDALVAGRLGLAVLSVFLCVLCARSFYVYVIKERPIP